MSADNYMAVRMIGDKWHAWMVLGGYEESDWTEPRGYWHKEFDDPLAAVTYAANVCQDEVVEYGITYFPEEDGEDSDIRAEGSFNPPWVKKGV